MDKNTRINGKNTYKPYYQKLNEFDSEKEQQTDKKSEKLIDIQAPENSLILTPSMDNQKVLEIFYQWFHNTYGEKLWCSDRGEINWNDVEITPQPLTRDSDKIEIINLNEDNNV